MSVASRLKAWIALLRPHQYTKNALIFVPMVFAQRWDLIEKVVEAFVLWSLMASAVYAFNDARDALSDRAHPTKRRRPVAAGLISPSQAYVAAFFLGVGSLTGAFVLNVTFGTLLLAYLLNNLFYTFWLKRFPLWDVFSITGGFLLRTYGGAIGGAIPISVYLFMTVFFLSLFLALGKRRHEILLLGGPGSEAQTVRKSLRGYSVYYLDQLMNISATLTLVVYILYLMHATFGWMLATLPIVVMGLFRYYHLTHNYGAGEPSRDLFADPLLVSLGIAYGFLAVLEMSGFPTPDKWW